ncbi:hypothetical protein [Microbacterium imperiale]|uniref:Uncharacterized protein n=1 Tax=Microbacterium imperiale TaxID=33884 RepID=A0A9W6M1M7_9MICO|nr:hypothetical protein [Microbacterium imperiale]MBP2420025.1 hypothetical protein [Microbacterium imperiale]MDS0198112.1 hypothetical protein [Microbacterium imperiale]BFE40366.1 hypothetical protein GCM10017544_13220 [Microbacterium imperiale]GLJ78658.1 hypothetical protein GCM10017586_03400 [Microbacterium imperiale]
MTGFTIERRQHPTQDIEVEAVVIDSVDTLRAVRDERNWIEGQLSILTYPTAPPVARIASDPPRYFGTPVNVGDTVLKGPGGDFEVLNAGA